jgi:phage portal protein BeeE
MDADEKKQIQQSWYRRSKDEVIITESDVQWNPMSFPTKDLMLFEELNADKMAIIDAYGLNAYLFSQEKGATFTNVKEGIRMAYQDTIIPETQQMYDSIAHQIGLKDEGITLVADFSHIPSLQEDENLKAQSMKIKAEAIEKIMAAGVQLNEDEIREISGLNN